MKYNVMIYGLNDGKFKSFNIFDHVSFREEVMKELAECETKKDFATKFRSTCMYYYWCKSEWEIITKPWLGRGEEEKIDVWYQIEQNFDMLVNYLWKDRYIYAEVNAAQLKADFTTSSAYVN